MLNWTVSYIINCVQDWNWIIYYTYDLQNILQYSVFFDYDWLIATVINAMFLRSNSLCMLLNS